jgi:hypothetical protein
VCCPAVQFTLVPWLELGAPVKVLGWQLMGYDICTCFDEALLLH